MKAAPFSYVRPTRLADAVCELNRANEDGGGKVLAGGQSLVPVLAMRLGRPGTLIDITAIPELNRIDEFGSSLRIGAGVRQRRVEREVGTRVPLLAQALPWIGHREIRSRGTVCGSLSHADPAAELPAVARCLGAVLEIIGPGGTREVPAADFFQGAMTTALQPTEIVTAARFPLAAEGEAFGFAEIARRHGDFALAGVAVKVRQIQGQVDEAVVTAIGVSDRPQFRDMTEPLRTVVSHQGEEQRVLARRLEEATAAFADDVVTTGGDSSASPAYRRRLIRVLAARELARAYRSCRRS